MPNIKTRTALLHFNAWLEMLRERFDRLTWVSESPHFSPVLALPLTISPAVASSSSSYTSSAVPESDEDIDITWFVGWKQMLDDMLLSDKMAMAPGNLHVLKGELAKISFTKQGLLASLEQALDQDILINGLAVQNIDDIRTSMNMSDLDVDESAFGEEFSSRRRVETYRFAIAIERVLKHSEGTHLDFHDNGDLFCANSVIVIAEVLKVNSTVTHVDLHDQEQIDVGPVAIAEALKVNDTLTTLNLNGCKPMGFWVSAAGNVIAVAIAAALKSNSALSTLDLGWNNIGDEGTIALAEALKVNSNLTTLDLSGNYINDDGAIALAEALKINGALTTLDLRDNDISQPVLDDIERSLARNRDNLRNKGDSLFYKLYSTLFTNKLSESSNEEGEALGSSSSKRSRPDDKDIQKTETSSKAPRTQ